MCQIIVAKAGIEIPRDVMQAEMDWNSDGWGVMYPWNNNLTVLKGLKSEEALRLNERIPVEVPRIWHFRLATHGRVDVKNAHPFRINQHLAVAHNGIVAKYATLPGDSRSDTRRFVDEYLRPLLQERPWLFETSDLNEAIREVDLSSRFAFLNGEGRIHLVGAFREEDNLFFSATPASGRMVSTSAFRWRQYYDQKDLWDWREEYPSYGYDRPKGESGGKWYTAANQDDSSDLRDRVIDELANDDHVSREIRRIDYFHTFNQLRKWCEKNPGIAAVLLDTYMELGLVTPRDEMEELEELEELAEMEDAYSGAS